MRPPSTNTSFTQSFTSSRRSDSFLASQSAIANWEAKNENERLEDTKLCVKEVFVDGGRMLKRIQAAPQGRAHRIRKRSNHVTIVVDKMVTVENK